MRSLLVVPVVAGCAAAGSLAADDASRAPPVADAARFGDAPQAGIDAHVADAGAVDAAAIDAPPDAEPIDARPDAEPVDARPIDAAPDACVPQVTQLLLNPSFDLAPVGTDWDQHPIQNIPGGPYPLITKDGEAPQTPPDQAFLGGIDGEHADPPAAAVTDELFQQVAIPANTTQLVLTGYYFVASEEDPSDPTVYDTGDVGLLTSAGVPIEDALSVSNVTAASLNNYTAFSHTFAANVAGQTVRLRFTSTNDEINPTAFYFDTLTLEATHCD